MNNKTSLIQPEPIEQVILLIRGQRVMLDRDLAALYGVATGNLNKAVQRNLERFPADCMFQLTADEAEALRFRFGSLKRGQHFKYLPQVFTQEGVAMLSSVLRSPRAVQVNISPSMGRHKLSRGGPGYWLTAQRVSAGGSSRFARRLRRFNAEAQRLAERFFSAFLRVPLRLCVKPDFGPAQKRLPSRRRECMLSGVYACLTRGGVGDPK